MIIPAYLHERHTVDLTVLMLRRDRPDENRAELTSLLYQTDCPSFEVVVLDDSTSLDTPRVFKEFSDRLNIKFFHLDGWHQVTNIWHSEEAGRGRTSLSIHFNMGIRVAVGRVVLIECGEMVHTPESLYTMYSVHSEEPNIVFNGVVRDISLDRICPYLYINSPIPSNLDRDGDEWIVPRNWTGDGIIFTSVLRSNLLRIRGYDEQYMIGRSCEDEEFSRRLVRSGNRIVGYDKLLAYHLSHSRSGRVSAPENYRATQHNMLMKDAGYADTDTRVKYYRPASNLVPVKANETVWGCLPHGVEVWTLDETLERLL